MAHPMPACCRRRPQPLPQADPLAFFIFPPDSRRKSGVLTAPSPTPAGGHMAVRLGDFVFGGLVRACAIFVIVLLIAVTAIFIKTAMPSIQRFGLNFLVSSDWDSTQIPANCVDSQGTTLTTPECEPGSFGGLPYMIGTVITSLISLALATPLAVGTAIFISEYAPPRVGDFISFVVEMLVAIPSVVYGLWALAFLVPILGDQGGVEQFLANTLGQIPIIGGLFANPLTNKDYFTASLILTIMILPTILAISREVVRQVPKLQKAGMIALGATKWEAIRLAVLPYARAGIIGGAMLGLARALGETMAVTMTIGNNPSLNPDQSLFNSGITLASGIANRIGEANGLGFSAIVELGLLLLIVSTIINLLSRVLVSRTVRV